MTSENRILDLLAEGRLVRGTWASTDAQGRALLCLLTALTGDPETRPDTCPADLAPMWVAYLMPWWDDAGTAERWLGLMRQIGELAPRFGELYGETGRRALAGCQLVSLRVALRYASEAVAPVVERVIALRERVLRGEEPTDDEWRAATEAAAEAESATAASAAARAEAAWVVVAATAASAASAAVWASEDAVRAAEACVAEAASASRTASDEIIQGHIDAIRAALNTSS